MAWRFVKAEILPLTRNAAQAHSVMTMNRGERPFKQSRYDWLMMALENGRFIPPRWATAVIKEGGFAVRVDGQHSSKVLAECDDSIFPRGAVAVVHMDRYECETEDDLMSVFEIFDPKKSARSIADLLSSAASLENKLHSIAPTVITRAVNGLAYAHAVIQNDAVASSKNVSPAERARLVRQHADFIVWAAQFIATKLKADAVVAAIWFTHLRDRQAATDFWRRVRDEDGPVGSPVRVLANYLRDIDHTWSFRDPGSSRRAVLSKCIHAWNAHREGRTTRLMYYAGSAIPEAL